MYIIESKFDAEYDVSQLWFSGGLHQQNDYRVLKIRQCQMSSIRQSFWKKLLKIRWIMYLFHWHYWSVFARHWFSIERWDYEIKFHRFSLFSYTSIQLIPKLDVYRRLSMCSTFSNFPLNGWNIQLNFYRKFFRSATKLLRKL